MQHRSFTLWDRLQDTHVWGRENYMISHYDQANNSYPSHVATNNDEERTALRWRSTVLRLSDHFTATAAAHPALAPVLLEALGNALEQLLLFGRERDLTLLEEWLDEELLNMS
jgi:hypothetical protein